MKWERSEIIILTIVHTHSYTQTNTLVLTSNTGKEEKIIPTELILINSFKTAIFNLSSTDNTSDNSLLGLFSLLLTVLLSEPHQMQHYTKNEVFH